ncbi:putative pheromone processing carboxypeptidase [Mollisia scopiformis]|uniref:Carboxypeptidase n=1 Tax=Mollisia scopiformis TaxID=149040 RepID=A0A194XXB2_MOLSC|nr:putative pheromone processing carboxypeptidase [Mollisia scopiformis]KUJ24427.1 putative pheromone processing carboxypeptidase [Mollisia scopiformis]
MALSLPRLSLLFVACLSSIASVSGNRYGDKVHWHGRDSSHNLTAREEPSQVEARSTKGFRFLTEATEPFRVKSLPDVDFDVGEMYSGLMPIQMNDTSRALFFVYQPTIGAPVDEITIWLNGGPGCSSLEGFFQENGRFLWQTGTYAPVENAYSWVNLTNVLWVEQPVGTGFSPGKVTATTQEEIAQDFVGFFLNFQKTFGIKKFKIYVAGESYAGRYVPYISAAMIDQHDTNYFDLSGAMTYDPCIGSFDYVQEEVVAVPFVHANNAVLNINSSYLAYLDGLDETCGYADFRNKYLQFPPTKHQPITYFSDENDYACDVFDMAVNAALNVNPCYNIYHVSDACPLQSDVLGFPGLLEYITPGLPVYFDRADVKKAVHAPDTPWVVCSNEPVIIGPPNQGPEEYTGDLSADPIQHVLPKVIEHTNRTLISNAQLDMIIITNGTLLSIQNMTWNGKLGFQQRPSTPIVITLEDLQYEAIFDANGYEGLDDPQGTLGVQHFERGLMWAETWAAGHMQPGYQPRSSYRHLQWLLGHIETL